MSRPLCAISDHAFVCACACVYVFVRRRGGGGAPRERVRVCGCVRACVPGRWRRERGVVQCVPGIDTFGRFVSGAPVRSRVRARRGGGGGGAGRRGGDAAVAKVHAGLLHPFGAHGGLHHAHASSCVLVALACGGGGGGAGCPRSCMGVSAGERGPSRSRWITSTCLHGRRNSSIVVRAAGSGLVTQRRGRPPAVSAYTAVYYGPRHRRARVRRRVHDFPLRARAESEVVRPTAAA